MSARLRRCLTGLGTAVVLALGGCASSPPDLTADAAARLQAAVLEVSESAAQGRYDATARAVEEVRAVLVQVAEEGAVSAARYAEVEAALRKVEEELAAQRSGEPAGAVGLPGVTDGASGADGDSETVPETGPETGSETDPVTDPVTDPDTDRDETPAGDARTEDETASGTTSDAERGRGPHENPGRGPEGAQGQGPGDAPGRRGP